MEEYSWRRYYGRGGAILYRRVRNRRPAPAKKPAKPMEPKGPVSFEELPEDVRHAQEVALRVTGERDD